MNIRRAAVILLVALGTFKMEAAEKIQVDVYIQKGKLPQQPLKDAEWLASEIFRKSDVQLSWHDGDLPVSRNTGHAFIGIRMMECAPASVSAGALASAQPFGSSGSLIDVYEDRVQRMLERIPRQSNVLLGYILAHELAHVILGYDYHSNSGILKGHWSSADHTAMLSHRLAFTAADSERIRKGLSLLAAR